MGEILTIFLGIDDTDTRESRGTGRLARTISGELSAYYEVTGITRHQLYVHPDIPYTSHNSSSVIHINDDSIDSIPDILNRAKEIMNGDFVTGSDPGICIASCGQINQGVMKYGINAKNSVLTQGMAKKIAGDSGIYIEGLGGTNDGIIGALAGVALAASGNDGRYILKGSLRNLNGSLDVSTLMDHGVDLVKTRDGRIISEGLIEFRKFPKPALINNKAIVFVEENDSIFRDLVVG